MERAALTRSGAPSAMRGVDSALDLQVSSARFEVLRTLGQGGMAVVVEVFDRSNGERLALKRLLPEKLGDGMARAMLEREFHTLSQLGHPRVVRVIDFDIDAHGPFYTMELLDGGDLQSQAPIGWRAACSQARDVCSVLSLIHSRGLVHRDISPRNVRCLSDGAAKLLDFGALMPMGPVKELVGTPSMCAPEVARCESADARADLYSLGSTLYYALTGRAAYPATDFERLPLLWETPPQPPSHHAPDVPEVLDRLVLNLLHLDPARRPRTAGEVVDQLGAIAGLPSVDDQLPVSRAYLAAPALVGRDHCLDQVRRKLVCLREGFGGGLVISGAAGAGRSRLLEVALLEAKVLGVLGLRADAGDGSGLEPGVVVALVRRMLRARPALAVSLSDERRRVLGHLLPELSCGEASELAVFRDSQQRRQALQATLLDWLQAVSQDHPLVIGVDDFDRIDEFSAACLALLASRAASCPLLVCVSVEIPARALLGPTRLIADGGTTLSLANLDETETLTLLRSLFGNVPHLRRLAHDLHRVAAGNPRDSLALARDLVQRGLITQSGGVWALAHDFSLSDLPVSMTATMVQRLEQLDVDGLTLARTLALAPDHAFELRELAPLGAARGTGQLLACLDRLLGLGVLRCQNQRYRLAHRGWCLPLLQGCDEAARRALFLGLADAFRAGDQPFREAQCLLQAGERERGLSALVQHARRSQVETDDDRDAFARMLQALPEDWLETYRLGMRLCHELGRPKAEFHALCSRASGLASVHTADSQIFALLNEQLTCAAGLDIYWQLGSELEPKERLTRALQLAQARYDAAAEGERVLSPSSALRPLVRACIQQMGCMATRQDVALWETIPSLAPLAPLAPVFGLVDRVRLGLGARLGGRTEEATRIYEGVLHDLAQPDRGGLDVSHHHYLQHAVTWALGLMEASVGRAEVLARVERIETDPLLILNGLALRKIHHLWQADTRSAEECQHRFEQQRVMSGPMQFWSGAHLGAEIVAHAALDDLTHLKQGVAAAAALAQAHRAWVPVVHFATSEYQRVRGDDESALAEIERASCLVSAGRHPLFCEIAAAHVRALCRMGRHDEACELGARWLGQALASRLGHGRHHLALALSPALARLGHGARAAELADGVLGAATELRAGRLFRALAHEARARVALLARDVAELRRQLHDWSALAAEAQSSALTAKLDGLAAEARALGLSATGSGEWRSAPASSSPWKQVLARCPTPLERAKTGLALLADRVGAKGAVLYVLDGGVPIVATEVGSLTATPRLDGLAAEVLRRERSLDRTQTSVGSLDAVGLRHPAATPGEPLAIHCSLLAHPANDDFLVTGVVVFGLAPGDTFLPPARLAMQLSQYWHELGDVTALSRPPASRE